MEAPPPGPALPPIPGPPNPPRPPGPSNPLATAPPSGPPPCPRNPPAATRPAGPPWPNGTAKPPPPAPATATARSTSAFGTKKGFIRIAGKDMELPFDVFIDDVITGANPVAIVVDQGIIEREE